MAKNKLCLVKIAKITQYFHDILPKTLKVLRKSKSLFIYGAQIKTYLYLLIAPELLKY